MDKEQLNKYKQRFGKEHYRMFAVNLKIDEHKELMGILNENNIKPSEFLRDSIAHLKRRIKNENIRLNKEKDSK